ncbi:MAG: hypothetical protein LBT53_01375 [Puniceicoccales bacterium]|jgi:DNA polymerase-1|nr:hypothetical protein [Puniceicoccales bacterium]
MKWLLIDGFNLAFRAYHALPALTRADGFPVGAIQGWVRILWKLREQEGACSGIVFFDKDGSQRHLALHPSYKANRPKAPEEFKAQLPELKTLSPLMGFRVVERSGVEADDLIASAAKTLTSKGDEVRIASADKDFAQCAGGHVRLLTPPPPTFKGAPAAGPRHAKDSWRELDAEGVREKFGVRSEQIIDYLSLVGDTVDNIPGMAGVGPKTAVAWLAEHGSIAGILAAQERIEPARFRDALRTPETAALLALNQKLITFRDDFEGDWDTPPPEEDAVGFRAFLERMELRALLAQFERKTENRTAPHENAPEQLELF